MAALRSNPALVARHTVVVVFVWDEGLGTDRLLAAVTRKTVLVPRGAGVLQHPRSCQRERESEQMRMETERFVIVCWYLPLTSANPCVTGGTPLISALLGCNYEAE